MTEVVHCGLCKKSREIRTDPTAIQTQRVCMALPPQIVAIPRPQGIQLTPMFPPVTDQMSCYLFEPLAPDPQGH